MLSGCRCTWPQLLTGSATQRVHAAIAIGMNPDRKQSRTLSSADTVEAPTLPVPPRTRTRLPSLRSRRCARSSAAVDGPLPFCCCAAAAVISWLPCRRRWPRRPALDLWLSSSEALSRRLGWGSAVGSSQDVSDRVTRELL